MIMINKILKTFRANFATFTSLPTICRNFLQQMNAIFSSTQQTETKISGRIFSRGRNGAYREQYNIVLLVTRVTIGCFSVQQGVPFLAYFRDNKKILFRFASFPLPFYQFF